MSRSPKNEVSDSAGVDEESLTKGEDKSMSEMAGSLALEWNIRCAAFPSKCSQWLCAYNHSKV